MMSLDNLTVVPGKKPTQLTVVGEKKLFVEGSAEQIAQLKAALEGLIGSRAGAGATSDATSMADMLFANSCRRDTVDGEPFGNQTREYASSTVSASGNPFGD